MIQQQERLLVGSMGVPDRLRLGQVGNGIPSIILVVVTHSAGNDGNAVVKMHLYGDIQR